MTVVLSRDEMMYPADPVCTVCGDRQYHPPFVFWSGATDLVLCGRCCRNLRTGLVADMVQLAAIEEMRDLSPGYRSFTLVRKRQEKVDAEVKAEIDAQQKAEEALLAEVDAKMEGGAIDKDKHAALRKRMRVWGGGDEST